MSSKPRPRHVYRVYFEPDTYHVVSARNVNEAMQRGRESYRSFHLGVRPIGKPVKVERFDAHAVRIIKGRP